MNVNHIKMVNQTHPLVIDDQSKGVFFSALFEKFLKYLVILYTYCIPVVVVFLFSRVHATLQPALSVGRLVGWSVGRSVTLYFFL